MVRWAGSVGIVLALAPAAARAHEEDPAPPPVPARVSRERRKEDAAVAAALEAAEAGDAARLAALAGADDPDPWIVADLLCARGEFDAAAALAGASTRKPLAALPRYVESRRPIPRDAALDALHESMRDAIEGRRFEDALRLLDGTDLPGGTVIGIRLDTLRATALGALERWAPCEETVARCASLAEEMGWTRIARGALVSRADAARGRKEWRPALALYEKALGFHEEAEDRPAMLYALVSIGVIRCDRLREPAAARDAFERALAITTELGDARNQADILANLGIVHQALREPEKSLEYRGRALALMEESGDRVGQAGVLMAMGCIDMTRGEREVALGRFRRAAALFEEAGDHRAAAKALEEFVARAAVEVGDPGAEKEALERALAHRMRRGDRREAATTHWRIGLVCERTGALREALQSFQTALRLKEECADPTQVAALTVNVGTIQSKLGLAREAIATLDRALEIAAASGERAESARALKVKGKVLFESLGAWGEAREVLERARHVFSELGDRAGEASALQALGVAEHQVGLLRAACATLDRALAIGPAEGPARARTMLLLGSVESDCGRMDRAFKHYEAALAVFENAGETGETCAALLNLGTAYSRIGVHERALRYYQRAVELAQRIGDEPLVAMAQGNVGPVLLELGDLEGARAALERCLEMYEKRDDRAGAATALGNLGLVHQESGDLGKALAAHERALALKREIGDRLGEMHTLGNIGNIQNLRGERRQALETRERVRAMAVERGSVVAEIRASIGVAVLHRRLGDPGRAVAVASEAARLLPEVVGGIGDAEGASARQGLSGIFVVGGLASMDLRDADGAARFLDGGRAGALLEAFGVRRALREEVLPADLLKAEDAARDEEARARADLGEALRAGDADRVARARERLAAAGDARAEVVGRIQRGAKAAAQVTYPVAEEPAAVRARLLPGEALVVYGVAGEGCVAVVATAKDARVVDLGGADAIGAAVAALRAHDPTGDPAEAVAALRKAVVEPLALGAGIRRVLVSPEGALCFVPWALVFAAQEVACVPSGTALLHLREGRGTGGGGTLALGDPAYPEARAAVAAERLRSGWDLRRLPSSGEEARAVGTTVLLGPKATVAGWREALATRPRWRSVHFACHALVDGERPLLSALALSPAGDDDGFLGVLDVFRTTVPADIVVLSACETGRGKAVHGEGMVGLVRAFMFAGAPRVLASVWKVDDEATRALMVRFYSAWNGGNGAAAGLREAQAFVAGHEAWRHPRYWGAWVLWGLPE